MKNPFKPCEEYVPPPAPDFPRFCRRCGSALTAVCDQIGYEETTGAPKFFRWLRCPKWDGGYTKLTSPLTCENAAHLNETFTARKYGFFGWDVNYIDCAPAYSPPPAAKRTRVKS